jgi:hypothetical protein
MRPIDGAEAVLEEVGVLAVHTRDAMLARLVAVGQEAVAGVEARIDEVADDPWKYLASVARESQHTS